MRKVTRTLLAAVGIALWVAGANAQTIVLDQQQPIINTTAGIVLAIGGGVEQQRLAQVVTAGITGKLTRVALAGGCSVGSRLVVTIQGTAFGKPNNVALASATFSGVTGPAGTFNVLTLPTPVQFNAGDSFAIVFSTPSPADSCATWPGPAGNPYAGGDGYVNSLADPSGSWGVLSYNPGIAAGADLPFQTYVELLPAAATAVPTLTPYGLVGLMVMFSALGAIVLASRARRACAKR
jgi:hypothetical protein